MFRKLILLQMRATQNFIWYQIQVSQILALLAANNSICFQKTFHVQSWSPNPWLSAHLQTLKWCMAKSKIDKLSLKDEMESSPRHKATEMRFMRLALVVTTRMQFIEQCWAVTRTQIPALRQKRKEWRKNFISVISVCIWSSANWITGESLSVASEWCRSSEYMI